VLGVDVFLHWSWLFVAAVEIETRKNQYSTQIWNVAEYLTLFAIVFAHEMGHALACRSVGGRAERIVLWPLGGIAYVAPPPRPGALLWSIAAGPLVNFVLALASLPLVFLAPDTLPPDAAHFAIAFFAINVGLLCFNLLPIYPLDGGKIVQALLWFFVGPARALGIVSSIGIVGSAAIVALALAKGSFWLTIVSVYAGTRAMTGLRVARQMRKMADAPRREGFACPRCNARPPVGDFWVCPCGARFDTFAVRGRCPTCGRTFPTTACNDCHQLSPHAAFYPPQATAPAPAPRPDDVPPRETTSS
jgi:Zn-dependent protease